MKQTTLEDLFCGNITKVYPETTFNNEKATTDQEFPPSSSDDVFMVDFLMWVWYNSNQ